MTLILTCQRRDLLLWHGSTSILAIGVRAQFPADEAGSAPRNARQGRVHSNAAGAEQTMRSKGSKRESVCCRRHLPGWLLHPQAAASPGRRASGRFCLAQPQWSHPAECPLPSSLPVSACMHLQHVCTRCQQQVQVRTQAPASSCPARLLQHAWWRSVCRPSQPRSYPRLSCKAWRGMQPAPCSRQPCQLLPRGHRGSSVPRPPCLRA